MKRLLLIPLLSAFLVGCSVNQNQLATQYATLRLLEGEHVTQQDVLSRVERVRVLLDGEYVALDAVYEAVGWERLQPSERLLVSAIISDIGTVGTSELIPSERAYVVLDWIEQAARLY